MFFCLFQILVETKRNKQYPQAEAIVNREKDKNPSREIYYHYDQTRNSIYSSKYSFPTHDSKHNRQNYRNEYKN